MPISNLEKYTQKLWCEGQSSFGNLQRQIMIDLRPFQFPEINHDELWASVISKIPLLERCLVDNIAQFWLDYGIGKKYGGYITNLSNNLGVSGPPIKGLVSQARLIWFFSRLYRSDHGESRHLDAANHGYDFLCDSLFYAKEGGFYWQ